MPGTTQSGNWGRSLEINSKALPFHLMLSASTIILVAFYRGSSCFFEHPLQVGRCPRLPARFGEKVLLCGSNKNEGAERDLQVASPHGWKRALKYFYAYRLAQAEAA